MCSILHLFVFWDLRRDLDPDNQGYGTLCILLLNNKPDFPSRE